MKGIVSTKEKILTILKQDREPACTLKDILHHFTISETAVRKHLQELINQGYVKESVIKQEIGRPYHLYALTGKGHATFPHQNKELPLELLQDLEEVGGKEVVNQLLLKRKEREQEQLAKKINHFPFSKQVEKLVDTQNERGYMMEYETDEDGNFEVVNYNCPIYNIATTYDQICTNEKNMLTDIFPESDVCFHSCIASGGKYCGWYITKPEEKNKSESS